LDSPINYLPLKPRKDELLELPYVSKAGGSQRNPRDSQENMLLCFFSATGNVGLPNNTDLLKCVDSLQHSRIPKTAVKSYMTSSLICMMF
jgi:hypothetical protein